MAPSDADSGTGGWEGESTESSVVELPAEAASLSQRFAFEREGEDLVLKPRRANDPVSEVRIIPGGAIEVNGKLLEEVDLLEFLPSEAKSLLKIARWSLEQRLALAGPPPGSENSIESAPNWAKPSQRVTSRGSGPADDRVSISRPIVVEEAEGVGEAVCFGCSIEVRGVVTRDAVSFGGSVRLAPGARVGGDAVAFGGSIALDERSRLGGDGVAFGGHVKVAKDARVAGDAVAFGGRLKVEDGGIIEGKSHQIQIGSLKRGAVEWAGAAAEATRPKMRGVVRSLGRAVGLALLSGLIWLLLGRQRLEPVSARVVTQPWQSFFWGAGTLALSGPLLLVVALGLVITIVGIPFLLLLPAVILSLAALALVGYSAMAGLVGRWAFRSLGQSGDAFYRPAVAAALGALLIQAPGVLGRIVGLPDWGLHWLGWGIVFTGFFVKVTLWSLGFGAVVAWILERKASRNVAIPSPNPASGQ